MANSETATSFTQSQAFGIGMILLGSVFVGVMPNAAKIAYQDGANPLALILLRTIFGALGMALFMIVRGRKFGIARTHVKQSAIAGIAQFFCALGFMGSVAYIDVSLASLLIFFFPFIVAVISHWRGDIRLTPMIVGCMIVATVGLGLALGVKFGELDMRGVYLAIIGAIAMATMVFSASSLSSAIGATPANFFMTCWAAFYYAAVALILPSFGIIEPMAFPSTSLGWIAIVATGVTFTMGYVLFFVSALIIGPTRASTLSIVEPVMIILFAVLLVGEWLNTIQWVGIVLVLSSLFAMEMFRKPS